MPVAELNPLPHLRAGGGPSTPDPRVLRALAGPVIGQFDPCFTAIMDEVMQLGRATFLSQNARCFAVSGLASAGLEAVLNTLVEPGDTVAALDGGEAARIAERLGARVVGALDERPPPRLVVASLVEAGAGRVLDVETVARACHAQGALLLVEATLALGGREVRIDDWGIDAAVAGVDYCLGGPPGMSLVTYSRQVEERMRQRRRPPPVSYLDLLQLQAYWSPERLNHHTAPTSLVYGVREALRLVHVEGLEACWARHARVFGALLAGLAALGLGVQAAPPIARVELPDGCDEATARQHLRERFGVHVRRLADNTWRVGLLGAEATLPNVLHVLGAIEQTLHGPGPAVAAALAAAGREPADVGASASGSHRARPGEGG